MRSIGRPNINISTVGMVCRSGFQNGASEGVKFPPAHPNPVAIKMMAATCSLEITLSVFVIAVDLLPFLLFSMIALLYNNRRFRLSPFDRRDLLLVRLRVGIQLRQHRQEKWSKGRPPSKVAHVPVGYQLHFATPLNLIGPDLFLPDTHRK